MKRRKCYTMILLFFSPFLTINNDQLIDLHHRLDFHRHPSFCPPFSLYYWTDAFCETKRLHVPLIINDLNCFIGDERIFPMMRNHPATWNVEIFFYYSIVDTELMSFTSIHFTHDDDYICPTFSIPISMIKL